MHDIVLAFRWQSVVDFFVLTSAIYLLLRWGAQVRALRIVLGILLLAVGSLLARQLGLLVTSWVVNAVNVVAIVALLVVFQSEFRRALTRLDIMMRLWPRRVHGSVAELHAISDAAFSLAAARRGALIVLVRRDPVMGLISGGVPLGGEISVEILEAIFRKVSPVHDGAAIVEGARIARVGAILPLSERQDIPVGYGTRHRAALGLTERSDCLVIVVSEERGEVTLIHGREIMAQRSPEALFQALQELPFDSGADAAGSTRRWPLPAFHFGVLAAALGLAALVWVVPLWIGERTVRTVTVPIEYRNVPDGLEITEASAIALQVQLRTSAWAVDTISFATLVARFNLEAAQEGLLRIAVERRALTVPPGFTVERVSPQTLSVHLVRRRDFPSLPRK